MSNLTQRYCLYQDVSPYSWANFLFIFCTARSQQIWLPWITSIHYSKRTIS